MLISSEGTGKGLRPHLPSSRRMAPRMRRLPLICSFRGSTRMVRAWAGKCSARGVTTAVMLLASFSASVCASSGCSRASPNLGFQHA